MCELGEVADGQPSESSSRGQLPTIPGFAIHDAALQLERAIVELDKETLYPHITTDKNNYRQ